MTIPQFLKMYPTIRSPDGTQMVVSNVRTERPMRTFGVVINCNVDDKWWAFQVDDFDSESLTLRRRIRRGMMHYYKELLQ